MDADLYEWILARTGGGRKFASLSHAVDRGFRLLQLEEDGKIRILEEDEKT